MSPGPFRLDLPEGQAPLKDGGGSSGSAPPPAPVCPVCSRPFAAGDDVVVCPHCGAAHHRSCYDHCGRCYYSNGRPGDCSRRREIPAAERVCPNCGMRNASEAPRCAKCRLSLDGPEAETAAEIFAVVSPASCPRPVPSSEWDDAVIFIGPNADYYLPRFGMSPGAPRKRGWIWSAFFFPVEWLLYRKMWLAALAAFLLSAGLALLYLWALASTRPLPESLAFARPFVSDASSWMIAAGRAALGGFLLLRFLLAAFGVSLYRRHVLKRCRRLRRRCGDSLMLRYVLSRKGGVCPPAALLYAAALLLPGILAYLWL